MKTPIQPIYLDDRGVLRFMSNKIVCYMLDAGARGDKFDLNSLATMPFSKKDREQLAQLIGYSISGFGELSYVSDSTFARAEKKALKVFAHAEKKAKKDNAP